MSKMNIVCFGFGQVAKNFIKNLNNNGVSFKLTTTSREESTNKKFENINYESFQCLEKSYDKNLISRLEEADHILISIAPINGVDIVIKNFQNYFKSNKLKWVTYLSATSVYGDHNGEWVNEKSRTQPKSPNGMRLKRFSSTSSSSNSFRNLKIEKIRQKKWILETKNVKNNKK